MQIKVISYWSSLNLSSFSDSLSSSVLLYVCYHDQVQIEIGQTNCTNSNSIWFKQTKDKFFLSISFKREHKG